MSLAFGRNEECGLRCLYHGWKMDVDGNVVEMTSEPPESGFAEKVKVKAYPAREWGGFVWTYMGPAETMPEFEPPAFAPTENAKVSIVKIHVGCNWAQILEGQIDSAHSSSLHSSDMKPAKVDAAKAVDTHWLRPSTDKAPRLQVERTSYGFHYAAIRRPIANANTHDYVRVTVYVAPFTALIPPNNEYNVATLLAPTDDNNTVFHFIAWSEPAASTGGLAQVQRRAARHRSRPQFQQHPHPRQQLRQDRNAMKLGNFTGIKGIPNQDIAMWETMGPIADRTKEGLGASDLAVVEFRKLMVDAARAMRDGGMRSGRRSRIFRTRRSARSRASFRNRPIGVHSAVGSEAPGQGGRSGRQNRLNKKTHKRSGRNQMTTDIVRTCLLAAAMLLGAAAAHWRRTS